MVTWMSGTDCRYKAVIQMTDLYCTLNNYWCKNEGLAEGGLKISI